MKLNKIFSVLAASALVAGSIFTTSCNEDESLQRKGKPTLTLASNAATVTEGESAPITFDFEFAIKDPAHVRIEIVGGTGSEADVSFGLPTIDQAGGGFFGGEGYFLTIPAYTDSYTFDLATVQDLFPEDAETVELKFFSAGKGYAKIDQTFTVTINNYVQPNDDVTIRLEWPSTSFVDNGGDTVSGCDIDFDLEIYDAGGVAYDSYYDCPENIVMPETAADGTYAIVPSLWTTGVAQTTERQDLPVRIIVAKQGVWYNEVDLNLPEFNAADGGLDQGNGGAIALGALLVKNGTTFTLQDATGTDISTGRLANFNITPNRKK